MNIFKRIQYYFFPAKYYSIENSTFTNPSLEFDRLNDETILNITNYIQKHLLEVQNLSTKTLKTKKAFEFEKINDLIIFIVKALEFDYKNMEEEKWKFEYFMNYHFLDEETTCIYNKFTNPEANVGYMILSLISIRKYNEKYYCWLNIDGYDPA